MDKVKPVKTRGRPRAFDHENALHKALEVFWARGYEGASMSELTAALGINRPSLYAAFGNKEELFRKALAKYCAEPVSYIAQALRQPTAYEVVEMLLKKSAGLVTSEHNPRGCMIVQGALSCGPGSELIRQELIQHRKNFESALRMRFERAQAEKDLPDYANAAGLAKYIATVHQGMSVQATSGASYEELLAVIDMVLSQWPSNTGKAGKPSP